MQSQHLLFDLDDTLIYCNCYFESAREEFQTKMKEFFTGYPIDLKEVSHIQEQIDLEGIGRLGLGKVRFPESLVQAYLVCCDKLGKPPLPAEQQELETIGYSVYARKPELLPDALSVLQALSIQGHDLHLYTGGDYEVQTRKILESGLHVHFEEWRRTISEHKNKTVLEGILRRHGWERNRVWMIGNSARSDILPALESGLHAIHIPNENGWAFDQVDLSTVQKGRLFTARSIKEVPFIIEKHLGECNAGCLG